MRRFSGNPALKFVRSFARSSQVANVGKLGGDTSLSTFRNRGLSSTTGADGKIVASVVLERLPVVLPSLSPEIQISSSIDFADAGPLSSLRIGAVLKSERFDWQQQYRRHYPQEFLEASANRGEFDDSAVFEPAPTVTEADRANDHRSLNRALDRRLYLVLHGIPSGESNGKPVWHFPEKVYSKEPSLRQCAESALVSLVGDFSNAVYFIGNAPCGHLSSETPALKVGQAACNTRFFFRTQLLASELSFQERKHTDLAWISKEEVPLYFEGHEAEFLKKMLR